MLLLTSAFDIASSSHRNSARHMEKFVVQKNDFVGLFKCNVRNVQSIDTERTCLTSQIFAVDDFAKHRAGKRRLHLWHCGNIVQYSHGSIATPSTPQFKHVILASCRLDDVSGIIEQKWWQRVKLTSGIWLVLPHCTTFACEIMTDVGHKFRENFYINSNKNKSHHCCEILENHSVVEL